MYPGNKVDVGDALGYFDCRHRSAAENAPSCLPKVPSIPRTAGFSKKRHPFALSCVERHQSTCLTALERMRGPRKSSEGMKEHIDAMRSGMLANITSKRNRERFGIMLLKDLACETRTAQTNLAGTSSDHGMYTFRRFRSSFCFSYRRIVTERVPQHL